MQFNFKHNADVQKNKNKENKYMKNPTIITDSYITIVFGSTPKTVSKSSNEAQYNKVLALIKKANAGGTVTDDELIKEFDLVNVVKAYVDENKYTDNIVVKSSGVRVDGELVDNAVADKIVQFASENLPIKPLVNFLRKLMANPSYNSRQQLYKFLENQGFPITESGNFIAYKSVRSDYTDHHTGKFSNKIGNVLKMDRSHVDDNPNNHCSNGLMISPLMA